MKAKSSLMAHDKLSSHSLSPSLLKANSAGKKLAGGRNSKYRGSSYLASRSSQTTICKSEADFSLRGVTLKGLTLQSGTCCYKSGAANDNGSLFPSRQPNNFSASPSNTGKAASYKIQFASHSLSEPQSSSLLNARIPSLSPSSSFSSTDTQLLVSPYLELVWPLAPKVIQQLCGPAVAAVVVVVVVTAFRMLKARNNNSYKPETQTIASTRDLERPSEGATC